MATKQTTQYREYTKSTLAAAYGWQYKVFWRKFKTLMTDSDFKTRFGKYVVCFTPKQLQMLIDEWGEIPS